MGLENALARKQEEDIYDEESKQDDIESKKDEEWKKQLAETGRATVEKIDPKIRPEIKKQVIENRKKSKPESTVIEPVDFRKKPEQGKN